MVNATNTFAEATERLDNNTWRRKEDEDRGSDRQDGSSEESNEEGEGGERRLQLAKVDKAGQALTPTFWFQYSCQARCIDSRHSEGITTSN